MQQSRSDIQRHTAGGFTVAVRTVQHGAPSGVTVAWLHGLGSASTVAFANIARHPSLAGVTSLLIDLPGYGRSDQPADWTYAIEDQATVVLEILAKLVDRPVALFGHSMGGSVAIACAVRRPEALQRLIVAEPNLDPGMGTVSAHIATQTEQHFVGRGYAALLRATELQARRGERAAIDWEPTLRVASPVALHRSSVSLLANRSPTLRQHIESLEIPVVTIQGGSSAPLDPPLRSPRIRGYVVPEAGHSMFADNPDGFIHAMTDALGLPTRRN